MSSITSKDLLREVEVEKGYTGCNKILPQQYVG